MSCGVHPKFVTKLHYRHEGAVCLHDISNEIQLKESEIRIRWSLWTYSREFYISYCAVKTLDFSCVLNQVDI